MANGSKRHHTKSRNVSDLAIVVLRLHLADCSARVGNPASKSVVTECLLIYYRVRAV